MQHSRLNGIIIQPERIATSHASIGAVLIWFMPQIKQERSGQIMSYESRVG
jgi:hypothetical protein